MDNQEKTISLHTLIESILFYTAEPMSIKKLSTLTKSTTDEVLSAANTLKNILDARESGIRLIIQNNEVVLGTAPEVSSVIEQITKDEISKELSKASLETLSIICYKGPLTRSDIDYIRGVNSTFIIRNLLIRGIIEKLDNPKDARASLYGATFSALEYMGVTKKEDLPRYDEVQQQLELFLAEKTINDSVSDEEDKGEQKSEINSDIADNIDADVSEENEMNPNFDDEEIRQNLEEDINNETSFKENDIG